MQRRAGSHPRSATGPLSAAWSALGSAVLLGCATMPAMALDLGPLWDFNDPAGSERRLRDELARSAGDDALILQTQIARSFGLRRDFDAARRVLAALEPQLAGAGAEARARHQLELGRSFASATHDPASQTAADRQRARASFEAALATARAGRLDALAIDAIHMLAFVDDAPADQLRWAQQALALAEGSVQPAARRWEASLRNNLGLALHRLGRLDEALAQFEAALLLRQRGADAEATRVAHWMVAWTLRSLQRGDEALPIQLRLEQEGDAAGRPDPHVFAELEALYRARGDDPRARHYARRRAAIGQ